MVVQQQRLTDGREKREERRDDEVGEARLARNVPKTYLTALVVTAHPFLRNFITQHEYQVPFCDIILTY